MNITIEMGRTAWVEAKEDDDSNLPRSLCRNTLLSLQDYKGFINRTVQVVE
jgi:hypothetical protein